MKQARVNMVEIAWLAGLLEGEGSFFVLHDNRRGRWPNVRISLQMTDADVVAKAARIAGVSPDRKPMDYGPNRKPVYRLDIIGGRAVAWMLTLWTLMGERRRSKIAECVREWTAWKDKRVGPIRAARQAACVAGAKRRQADNPSYRGEDGRFAHRG